MATPTILESFLAAGIVSGSQQSVVFTTTPAVGDVIVLFMFHADLASPNNPFEVILNGDVLPCTAEVHPTSPNRDRMAGVFAHVVTAAGVSLGYRIQSESFSRGTHHAAFLLRGAGGFEGAFAAFGPGGDWADDATLSTSGDIPAVTTSGPNRRVLHGCLVTNGDNSITQPALSLSSWANTGMSGFVGPLHHIENPTSGSDFVVKAVGVTSGERVDAGSSGDVTVSSSSAGHWVYVGVAVSADNVGWSVGMVRW